MSVPLEILQSKIKAYLPNDSKLYVGIGSLDYESDFTDLLSILQNVTPVDYVRSRLDHSIGVGLKVSYISHRAESYVWVINPSRRVLERDSPKIDYIYAGIELSARLAVKRGYRYLYALASRITGD